nr:CDGSH iron-sulfur domain-containing protein [Mesorhizobium mediterraneum]
MGSSPRKARRGGREADGEGSFLCNAAPFAKRKVAIVSSTPPPGPLKLEGNLEIVTGTGHTVDRTQRTFPSLCGHSANKPFCDNSHKRVGFVGQVDAAISPP